MKIKDLAAGLGYAALGSIITVAGLSAAAGVIGLAVCDKVGDIIVDTGKGIYKRGKDAVVEIKKEMKHEK